VTPEACRRKALEFERAAEVATDPTAQRAYIDLADKWRERAEWAEAFARRLKGTGQGPKAGHQSTFFEAPRSLQPAKPPKPAD
jgi:hypothetical protein